MKFVPMSSLLVRALCEGYAVPSFCVWNAETIRTTLETAWKLRPPDTLVNGPGEFPLLSPRELGAIAYVLADCFDVPAAQAGALRALAKVVEIWIHLDGVAGRA